jgi:hypothetical protein
VSAIDRIRFYDGEFLRAFDFSDEQTYHVEMRRRLNRYLHLCGIVQGLTMVTASGSYEVSIMPGMAIDAFGREIYVYAPYTLGDSDVTNNRITSKNTYDVWLRYQKSPGTPPSSGYGNCNQANQYTRWVESFSVTLLLSPSTPFSTPGFADADSDDPSQDQVGVLLGTVYVDPTSPTATFSQPKFDPNPNRCALLGVIAQSIQTPPSWDATQGNPLFSFLNASGTPNSPLSPPASLEIKPNIFADQNLIVGQDFTLTPVTGGPNITITPSPTVTDPGAGSVKIAGDLFVQGNIYNLITSNTPSPSAATLPPAAGTGLWLGISSYVSSLVQQMMPDFVASQPLPIAVPNPAPSATSFSANSPAITIPSRLSAMSGVVASAAISGVQLNAPITFGSAVGVYINTVSALPGINQCTVSVNYTVTGDFAAGAIPSILSFSITATAVCFPK